VPIQKRLLLTEEEIEWSNSLLKNVVNQWSKLGNTSVEGLRENFLRRKGRLTKAKKNWVLRVHPKSFDMLLDFLPWGISMFTLPWNPYLIQVEWQ